MSQPIAAVWRQLVSVGGHRGTTGEQAPDAGLGLLPPDDGAGPLPWSWARQRLEASHDYWLATTRPDAHPHVMPLWGIWIDESFAFSTGRRSVKARNLWANPWCVAITEDPAEPVIVEGVARLVDDANLLRQICDAYAAKYVAARQDTTEGPLYLLAACAWSRLPAPRRFTLRQSAIPARSTGTRAYREPRRAGTIPPAALLEELGTAAPAPR